MHANKYTNERAEQLVPILRSIAREIAERTRTIEELEATVEPPSSGSARSNPSPDSSGRVARLANERRELRLAKQELSRFGCALDEDHPLRILIPGVDGTFENGHAWTPTDGSCCEIAVQVAS